MFENDSILVTVPHWSPATRGIDAPVSIRPQLVNHMERTQQRKEAPPVDVLRGSSISTDPKEKKLEEALIKVIKESRKADGTTDEMLLLAKTRSLATRHGHRQWHDGYGKGRQDEKDGVPRGRK